ncbi:hypothetical protein BZA77DRAFT_360403 [Pyronema omphalodes]|nr:hypothetical protein BZA77DRAFT_360403 [Pyronema omphalodes]
MSHLIDRAKEWYKHIKPSFHKPKHPSKLQHQQALEQKPSPSPELICICCGLPVNRDGATMVPCGHRDFHYRCLTASDSAVGVCPHCLNDRRSRKKEKEEKKEEEEKEEEEKNEERNNEKQRR